MDMIYHRYRGTMVDFDGNEFLVDWAAADPRADDFTLVTPFRSGIWADSRPYYLGDIGEIPQRFYPASHQVVPKRICLSCYIGNNSWWESGWPLGSPAVVLAPDGWPLQCDAGGPFFDCSCSALAVDYLPHALFAVAACSCSKVDVEYTTHAHYAVNACSCSTLTGNIGEGVRYGVNVCSCSTPDVEYTQTITYAVAACSCSKELLTQTAHVSYAVSVCTCSKVSLVQTAAVTWSVTACSCSALTFTYSTFVPLQTYGCSTLAGTGSTQGTAALIGDDNIRLTSSALANSGAILPDGCYRIFVEADPSNANNVFVYPPVGQQIRAQTVNTALTIFASQSYLFIKVPGLGRWDAIQIN